VLELVGHPLQRLADDLRVLEQGHGGADAQCAVAVEDDCEAEEDGRPERRGHVDAADEQGLCPVGLAERGVDVAGAGVIAAQGVVACAGGPQVLHSGQLLLDAAHVPGHGLPVPDEGRDAAPV
jgi:hypothetical protein